MHEADFLAWLRLRVALGEALGIPQSQVGPSDVANAPEKPPSLQACSPFCLARVGPLLQEQGQAVPADANRTWRLPAPSTTTIESCWSLIPAFHGRWGALWDLRVLEERWGRHPFSAENACAALAQREADAQVSRLHRRDRTASAVPVASRLRAMEAEGWLSPGPDLRLTVVAMDSLSRFRLVLSARFHVPKDSLGPLGRSPPPPRRTGGA